MRLFSQYDWNKIPDDHLILMTVRSINSTESMQIADFLDTEALKFSKTMNWIGMSAEHGLKFGKGPLRMIDGIWFCLEDVKSENLFIDFTLSPDLLILDMIV